MIRNSYLVLPMNFNPAPPNWMHIDFNSCFATIEQQANPLLRGKPLVVAAYATGSGCVLAPSIEAKTYGIKTGMTVRQAQQLCPAIKILSTDVAKYRYIHLKLKRLLEDYSLEVVPKSIDEFILNLNSQASLVGNKKVLGQEIKLRINQEIGDWLRVSIGFGPSQFLAKLAASFIKPDGLVVIDRSNALEIYSQLELEDLHGIGPRLSQRLKAKGIYSVSSFYYASIEQLKRVFGSVAAYHWFAQLRGWQYAPMEYNRRSFGNSYSPPFAITNPTQAAPVLMKLVQKTSSRLRKAGFAARGVGCSIRFRKGYHWNKHQTIPLTFDTSEIYGYVRNLLQQSSFPQSVHTLAVVCFNLEPYINYQPDLFNRVPSQLALNKAMDQINQRFGEFTLTPALMLNTQHLVPDRISFGKVKELHQ